MAIASNIFHLISPQTHTQTVANTHTHTNTLAFFWAAAFLFLFIFFIPFGFFLLLLLLLSAFNLCAKLYSLRRFQRCVCLSLCVCMCVCVCCCFVIWFLCRPTPVVTFSSNSDALFLTFRRTKMQLAIYNFVVDLYFCLIFFFSNFPTLYKFCFVAFNSKTFACFLFQCVLLYFACLLVLLFASRYKHKCMKRANSSRRRSRSDWFSPRTKASN